MSINNFVYRKASFDPFNDSGSVDDSFPVESGFEDTSDWDSSSAGTRTPAPPTPEKKVTPRTPPVREGTRLINAMTPGRSAVSQEKRALQEEINLLSSAVDSPNRQQRAKNALDARNSLVLRLVGAQDENRNIYPVPTDAGIEVKESWTGDFLNTVGSIYRNSAHKPKNINPKFLLDIKHLSSLVEEHGKLKGNHFFNEENGFGKDYEIVAKNERTGVIVANFKNSNGTNKKQSSFFPTWVKNDEELIDFLNKLELVTQCGSRLLYVAPTHNPAYDLYVECCLDSSWAVIKTAYPIFFYEEYRPLSYYEITDNIFYRSADILHFARKAYNEFQINSGPYELENGDMVLDIAKFIPNCPVKSGVLIQIKKNLLQNFSTGHQNSIMADWQKI